MMINMRSSQQMQSDVGLQDVSKDKKERSGTLEITEKCSEQNELSKKQDEKEGTTSELKKKKLSGHSSAAIIEIYVDDSKSATESCSGLHQDQARTVPAGFTIKEEPMDSCDEILLSETEQLASQKGFLCTQLTKPLKSIKKEPDASCTSIPDVPVSVVTIKKEPGNQSETVLEVSDSRKCPSHGSSNVSEETTGESSNTEPKGKLSQIKKDPEVSSISDPHLPSSPITAKKGHSDSSLQSTSDRHVPVKGHRGKIKKIKLPVKIECSHPDSEQEDEAKKESVQLKVEKQEGEVFQCDQCSEEFSSHCKLENHQRLNHGGVAQLHCDYCEYSTTVEDDFFNHVADHAGDMPFQCKQCNKGFITKFSLEVHEKTHKKEQRLQLQRKQHSCTRCGKIFDRSQNLVKHRKNCYEGDVIYRCLHCKKKFAYQTYLRSHIWRKHFKGRPEYQCLECNKIYFNKRWLVAHQKSHKGKVTGDCKKESQVCKLEQNGDDVNDSTKMEST